MTNVFLAADFDQDPQLPPIDKVITQSCLLSAGYYGAQKMAYTLVMREQPAVTPLMEVVFEESPESLIVLPNDADLRVICQHHAPEIVFFMAGGKSTMNDYERLQDNGSTICLAFEGTGGAAAAIHARQLETNTLPELARAAAGDVFGNRLLGAVFNKLKP